MYLCSVRKNKSINRSTWNNKNKKIMAATNYTVIAKNKEKERIVLINLSSKWTYKQALASAQEVHKKNDTHELVCVIEI